MNNLIGLLQYKAWLIEPRFAHKMGPIIARAVAQALASGNIESFSQRQSAQRTENDKIIDAQYITLDADRVYESWDEPAYYLATAKTGQKVAIIPMLGAITKNGDACSWGMRDYQNTLNRISKKEGISGVVLHFNNTPGGTHDGTPEISSFIRSMKKPKVSFVDGYAASAHYYMASQTDHIVMNKNTPSEVGSIGSLIVYENIANQIEAGEYPMMEIIRAPQSYNKALFNAIEPLTDTMRAELTEELRVTVKEFIAAVKKGRGDKLTDDQEMFSGKMYGTDEAIKNGLADSKGGLQDAINKAAELWTAQQSRTSGSNQSQSNSQMFSFKSTIFSGLFGKSENAKEPTAEVKAEMEAADQKAAEIEAENQTLRSEKAALTAKNGELEKSVSDLTGQVSTLTEKNATLETEKKELQTKLDAKPAGHATTVVSEGDPEGKQEKSYRTSVDAEVEKYTSLTKPNSK